MNGGPDKHGTNGSRPRPDTSRDILNIDEAAALLGVRAKTFNKVLHSEDVPARKVGREWKFSRQALIDWVGNGSSRDFYKETNEDEQGSTSGRKGRRTQGWRIELD